MAQENLSHEEFEPFETETFCHDASLHFENLECFSNISDATAVKRNMICINSGVSHGIFDNRKVFIFTGRF